MRSLAFLLTLSLYAESPTKLAPPEQTLDNIKQFAATHLDRRENLSCVQVGAPSSSKTVTVEFSALPAHGIPSDVDAGGLLEDVFAPSSATEFHWDHWATLKGKPLAVYNYSFQINGKTHAGSIFADENTGAISRITFRGAAAPAHLFCSTRSR
jgi:hypothetical protein